MGEAEDEMEMSRARASGGALSPEGKRSAWSQCAEHSGGSPEDTREEREKKEGPLFEQSTSSRMTHEEEAKDSGRVAARRGAIFTAHKGR